jgi:GH24 family phage-related lysozyme (muramidase)
MIIDLLKKDEGFRATPYDDATGKAVRAPVGNLTIGYGTNLAGGISVEEAEMLLRHRAKIATEDAIAIIGLDALSAMSEVRQAAFVCMAYQMGRPGLRTFKKTISYAVAGDYAAAAREMMDSGWGRNFKLRAGRLAAMMRTGEI